MRKGGRQGRSVANSSVFHTSGPRSSRPGAKSREWEKRDPPVKPRATFLISGTCLLVDKIPAPQQRPDLVRESKGDREGQLV